jgi:hypothetical protein
MAGELFARRARGSTGTTEITEGTEMSWGIQRKWFCSVFSVFSVVKDQK